MFGLNACLVLRRSVAVNNLWSVHNLVALGATTGEVSATTSLWGCRPGFRMGIWSSVGNSALGTNSARDRCPSSWYVRPLHAPAPSDTITEAFKEHCETKSSSEGTELHDLPSNTTPAPQGPSPNESSQSLVGQDITESRPDLDLSEEPDVMTMDETVPHSFLGSPVQNPPITSPTGISRGSSTSSQIPARPRDLTEDEITSGIRHRDTWPRNETETYLPTNEPSKSSPLRRKIS